MPQKYKKLLSIAVYRAETKTKNAVHLRAFFVVMASFRLVIC